MDEELKRCPFCGSNDVDADGWSSSETSGPACNNCGASAGDGSKTPEENIMLWNTRAE